MVIENSTNQIGSTAGGGLGSKKSFAKNPQFKVILADSDDEEEEAAIVSKVLDEIGIEISGKVTKLVSNLDFFSPRTSVSWGPATALKGC